jgi:hypothetical protein
LNVVFPFNPKVNHCEKHGNSFNPNMASTHRPAFQDEPVPTYPDLPGKVALVTGGIGQFGDPKIEHNWGNGAVAAFGLARCGVKIFACDLDVDAAERTKKRIEKYHSPRIVAIILLHWWSAGPPDTVSLSDWQLATPFAWESTPSQSCDGCSIDLLRVVHLTGISRSRVGTRAHGTIDHDTSLLDANKRAI